MYSNSGAVAALHECSNPQSRLAGPGIRDIITAHVWPMLHGGKYLFMRFIVMRCSRYISRVLSIACTYESLGFYYRRRFIPLFCAGILGIPARRIHPEIRSFYQSGQLVILELLVGDQLYSCVFDCHRMTYEYDKITVALAPRGGCGGEIASLNGHRRPLVAPQSGIWYNNGRKWFSMTPVGQVFRYDSDGVRTLIGFNKWMSVAKKEAL